MKEVEQNIKISNKKPLGLMSLAAKRIRLITPSQNHERYDQETYNDGGKPSQHQSTVTTFIVEIIVDQLEFLLAVVIGMFSLSFLFLITRNEFRRNEFWSHRFNFNFRMINFYL